MPGPDVGANAEREAVPSAVLVRRNHSKSDVDSSAQGQHHTLGPRANQAASGAHTHDGYGSVAIPVANLPKPLLGITISGAKAGNTALASVIAALVTLGATDITT